MFNTKSQINRISLLLLIFINALFALKYGFRYTRSEIIAILITLFYITILLFAIYYISNNILPINRENKKKYYWGILLLGIILIVFMNMTPETTRVGRLPAINEWLGNFIDGKFPYRAESNPSGFPFLFFIAAPFYLLGDVGYLEVFGLLLFILIIINNANFGKELILKLSLLLFSLPVFYELFVRSELLTNITLFIAVAIPIYAKLSKEDNKLVLGAGAIIMGMLLSTRLIVGLLLFLFLIFIYRNDFKKFFVFGIISFFVFLLTLLPFYLWDAEYFITKGPFSVQLLYLPIWAMIVFMIVIVYAGTIISSLREFFFASGIILFLLTLVSFSITIYNFGLTNALFNDYFDISYFIFALPFCILSLEEYKSQENLGRLLTDE